MKRSEMYSLRLSQIERSIEKFSTLSSARQPRAGWLRTIRESLGRSLRVQASKLGISSSTLQKSERAEAEDRITLGQLRKLAEGLDCELVYALVPRKPLHKIVEDRATEIAKNEVMGVTHTMTLEAQRPSDKHVDEKIRKRRSELLDGSWSNLWR